jgi:transcriptional regulator with XRE-family HTH domain
MKQDDLQQWREQLGLSQQALADYTGVSRSLICLVEQGERTLPLSAFLLVMQLMRTYEVARLVPADPVRQQNSLPLLQQVITDTTWQLRKQREELARIEAGYTQACYQKRAYQLTRQEIAAHAPAPDKAKQLHWLEMKEMEAIQQMEKTGRNAQIPVRLKITALQATLQEAQALLLTLPANPSSKEQ